MLTLRSSRDRGAANLGWLDSRHSFSFGNYYDPAHMGYASLRVINEDKVAPGQGFGTHGHRDMEIVTYVLAGELEHKDSLGNGSIIRPGDVQRMSAGTGIQHSEYNPSATDSVHLLQIWILPERNGIQPSYEQRHLPPDQGQLRLIGSQDGREGSVRIHQDINLYATRLGAAETVTLPVQPERHLWIQVAQGGVSLNGTTLSAGDGAAIAQESQLQLIGQGNQSEVLIFDMAA